MVLACCERQLSACCKNCFQCCFAALQECKYATGIDTGCVLGGELTALVLPSIQEMQQKGLATPPAEPVTLEACGGQLVQVKARKVYRRDDADD